MGITLYPYGYDRNRQITDNEGLLVRDGRDLVQALINRTGGALGGPIVDVGIVATGFTQADAALLEADWNYVETVPALSGVIIPIMGIGGSLVPSVGAEILVWNADVNDLNVYPPNVQAASGPVQIAGTLKPNDPYVLHPGKMQWFRQIKPTLLVTMQLQIP